MYKHTYNHMCIYIYIYIACTVAQDRKWPRGADGRPSGVISISIHLYIYIYRERERGIHIIYVYIYIYIYIYHVYIYIYIFIYTYTYIYIYIEREREIMFVVQRSTETMQQSVLWPAWRVKNQATLHLTPPFGCL